MVSIGNIELNTKMSSENCAEPAAIFDYLINEFDWFFNILKCLDL